MQLKLHLNKFLKVDNIEGYSLGTLTELQKAYDKFIENSDGYDPDFPMSNLGGKGSGNGKEGMKTTKFSGSNNRYSLMENNEMSLKLGPITKAKLNNSIDE